MHTKNSPNIVAHKNPAASNTLHSCHPVHPLIQSPYHQSIAAPIPIFFAMTEKQLYLLPSEINLRPRSVRPNLVDFSHVAVQNLLSEEALRSAKDRFVCAASHPNVEAAVWERLSNQRVSNRRAFLYRRNPFRTCGIDVLTKQGDLRVSVVNLMRKVLKRDHASHSLNDPSHEESPEKRWSHQDMVVRDFFNNSRFKEDPFFR
jgi:hypothetical protein